MEQTIQIPEGYEYSHMAQPVLTNGGGVLSVMLKKKNIKTFDFYVDEYLRSDDCTTNDMLCNWIQPYSVVNLKNNLKQLKFGFVPWEVKVGLLKFICNDLRYNFTLALKILSDEPKNAWYTKITSIVPVGFLESITK